jgi:hypothetical protein
LKNVTEHGIAGIEIGKLIGDFARKLHSIPAKVGLPAEKQEQLLTHNDPEFPIVHLFRSKLSK